MATPLRQLCELMLRLRSVVEFVSSNSRLLVEFNSEDVALGSWLAGTKAGQRSRWSSRGIFTNLTISTIQHQTIFTYKTMTNITYIVHICDQSRNSSTSFLKRTTSCVSLLDHPSDLCGAQVTRKHDPRFDTEWKSRGCNNKFLVRDPKGVVLSVLTNFSRKDITGL